MAGLFFVSLIAAAVLYAEFNALSRGNASEYLLPAVTAYVVWLCLTFVATRWDEVS